MPHYLLESVDMLPGIGGMEVEGVACPTGGTVEGVVSGLVEAEVIGELPCLGAEVVSNL